MTTKKNPSSGSATLNSRAQKTSAKTPVKKTVKRRTKSKKEIPKTDVVDPKILKAKQEEINKSMKEAEEAVSEAIRNTAQQSDYIENYSE